MAQFLSQAWFDQVERLNMEAGELNLSPNLAALLVNVQVIGDDSVALFLRQGKLYQGLDRAADATISIDRESLHEIISDFDAAKALELFMTGKIRIDGDMSKVLALQTTKPSLEQKTLYKHILAMTQFD